MANLDVLKTSPELVQQAAVSIAALDSCFMLGFGRLGPEQIKTLDAWAGYFVGTPLANRVSEAAAAIKRGELSEKHFVSLAAARASVQGSMCDALVEQAEPLCSGLNFRDPEFEEHRQDDPSHHQVWFESCRQWLMELAIAGFGQLTGEQLLPFRATLEKIEAEADLSRYAAFFLGFWNELVGSMPISLMPTIPTFRWVDLWTRGMLMAVRTSAPTKTNEVSGEFIPCGAEVLEHPFFVSLSVFGWLVSQDKTTWVRTMVSAFKVDVLEPAEIGIPLLPIANNLLSALSAPTSLTITAMPLLDSGDLLWVDSKAKVGAAKSAIVESAKLLTADKAAQAIRLPGIDRHPIKIALPVFLQGEKIRKDGEQLVVGNDSALPINTQRAGVAGIDGSDVMKATALLGLLRFDDGQWHLQPLACVSGDITKAKVAMSGVEWAKTTKIRAKSKSLEILKERSAKLLRAKSL